MQNPFSYTFGVKPKSYVVNYQYEEILENFQYSDPTEHTYIITGVRGSGKTVMLTEIASFISEGSDWIVIDINRERDILLSLAANLYDIPALKPMLIKAKIDISVFGIGLSVEENDRIYDIELAVEKLLTILKESGKKLLITMDEVRKNNNMKVFCQSYQRFIRKGLPVYLIMTGLYKDVYEIKNMDGCTFLNRAPFIIIEPLDINSLAVEYKRQLKVSKSKSLELAKLTKGYAFAFQVLGKLMFASGENPDMEEILFEYKSELSRYSYNIIWNELSETDKRILGKIVTVSPEGQIKRSDLMEQLDFTSSMMNRYQARLREKGILRTSKDKSGYYSLALPFFDSYVEDYYL